jgi:hypothetical protein
MIADLSIRETGGDGAHAKGQDNRHTGVLLLLLLQLLSL